MKHLLTLLLFISTSVMAEIIYLNCNEEVMIGDGLYDDYYGKKRSTIYRYDNIKKRIKSTSYYPFISNELACDEYETDLNCFDGSIKGRYERIYLNRITLEVKHYFHKQSERDGMDMWESKGKCDIENRKL